MKPGTQVIIFKYHSWEGNAFGIRVIEKEDYFAFWQYLDTLSKENITIQIPVGDSHIKMTGREIEQYIEVVSLTVEIEEFLNKLFYADLKAVGFDVVSAVTSEVTWRKFLADEDKRKKEQDSMVGNE